MTEQTSPIDALPSIVADVVAPNALAVDSNAEFPRATLDALGTVGLLGTISAKEVGGLGEGLRTAARVVEHVGGACGSSGMVLCMHFCAAAVIEQHGALEVRKEIAAGRHVTTLAFSEFGSRSHFWAPLSTATEVDGAIRLDARKSWSTSAGQVDSYVWSSRPVAAEGLSTIWLVPGSAPGLSIPSPFDGLGLRGNASSPITAENVLVPREAMLGEDGKGMDVMMGIVLSYFQVLAAACYLGVAEAALTKACAHVGSTQLSAVSQSLADLPTIRAYLAKGRIKVDMVRALLSDTLTAIETGREDAQLRVLEIKAAAGEAAIEVTEMTMRVCGGAAFRKEVGLERHFRDARAATVMSPTTDLLYEFIGRAICGLPLF
ncbi:acyl-CoA dehydrogenase family protein [Paraliomyxa miuraensis]|uniref:acyl-CoA dehydrogenase family protein n=1 Tax=Paraliomyxa miuraensis TaxID=376150 RepID=UPI00224EDC48|nr:acyl-CoA dehydrogenase family protein [Paraliomyxa miuraensis]MCX4246799.1 acyl-CoA/acyl-ACP dehydrogenase [Paraliomyxa miuraensis]